MGFGQSKQRNVLASNAPALRALDQVPSFHRVLLGRRLKGQTRSQRRYHCQPTDWNTE